MPKYNITIPTDVYFILNRLCECGYTAHIVGGCVRDMLIGKAPTDYDITTDATPEEIKTAFSDFRTVDTGIKHGTVTLIYNGAPYEITTYRIEGAYSDNRHPDSVSFTRNLSLDLSRRDFTVNAMCADKDGNLTDLYGGAEHLSAGVISAVGCAKKRFSEDALRILRAIRFSATLGFKLDAETAKAAFECASLLDNISVERIYTELYKLICGEYAYRVISEYGDIIKKVLPELSTLILPPSDRFGAASGNVRLASLFALGAENPEAAYDGAMRRLHTDTKTRVAGACALKYLSYPLETESDALKLLFLVGDEWAEFTAQLKKTVLGEGGGSRLLDLAKCSGKPYKFSDLSVSGAGFVASGLVGENIGRGMKAVLFAIMDGVIDNTVEEILRYIKKLKL